MRQAPLLYIALLLLLLLLVPALLVRGCGPAAPLPVEPPPPKAGPESAPPPEALPMPDAGIAVQVYFDDTGVTEAIPLEDYVVAVVAAELPPAFHDEALQAQAVLARTYAVRKMQVFGGPGGCGEAAAADVCGDYRDQAYNTYPQLVARLGAETAAPYWARVQAAVAATAGEIATFEGQPIAAVYHSTSAGLTEDAAEVWGQAYPYLLPVPSDDTSSFRYEEEVRMPLAEVLAEFGLTAVPVTVDGQLVAATGVTAGERVRAVRIGEETVAATDFRARLGLRSTDFTLREDGDELVIVTHGYGHGVGMSQFGANELATAGRSYRDIIAYYYPGVEVHPMFTE